MVTSEYRISQKKKTVFTVFFKIIKNLQVKCQIILWRAKIIFDSLAKRSFDIIVSLILMTMFLPIYILAIVAVMFSGPGSLFYKQLRVGRKGREFFMLKFRSMNCNADEQKQDLLSLNETDGITFKMREDPRVTRVGKFMRRFSIDELPQFWHVLTGDMSLVGPRPPVPEEVLQYSVHERRRLEVVPGITCIWQVSGRSDLSFNQQVEMDIQYIQNQSFLNDIILLIRTVPAVISGKGAY